MRQPEGRAERRRVAHMADVVRVREQEAEDGLNRLPKRPFLRQTVRRQDQRTAERPADRPLVRGADRGRVLIVGCGALARELVALTADLPGVDVACLSPDLHNRPERIPARVRARIHEGRAQGYEQIFVAYADCGTGGLLDPVLAEEGVERLPGAHCYEFFAGQTDFARLAEEEPATFWLTDFLARNFERLVIRGLGIDRHPELEHEYFRNYRRLVYLSQIDDPDLLALARAAAERLGLVFEHRHTGYGELDSAIQGLGARPASAAAVSGDQSGARSRATSESAMAGRQANTRRRSRGQSVNSARTTSATGSTEER